MKRSLFTHGESIESSLTAKLCFNKAVENDMSSKFRKSPMHKYVTSI